MTVFGILSTPRHNNRVLPNFEALKQTYLLRMQRSVRPYVRRTVGNREKITGNGICSLVIPGGQELIHYGGICFPARACCTRKDGLCALLPDNVLDERSPAIGFAA